MAILPPVSPQPLGHRCRSWASSWGVRLSELPLQLVYLLQTITIFYILSGIGDNCDITMQTFLQWCTGSKEVPPLDFPKELKALFVHGCVRNFMCRPSTSTCDVLVKLPVHIASEQQMTELLVSAIGDSYGFGNI